jgi:hypothetical protein
MGWACENYYLWEQLLGWLYLNGDIALGSHQDQSHPASSRQPLF